MSTLETFPAKLAHTPDELVEMVDGRNGLEIHELTDKMFQATVGNFWIDVLVAKRPGHDWFDFQDRVANARKTYEEHWGPVKLLDRYDQVSAYDFVVWIYDVRDRKVIRNPDVANEGLTMRMIVMNADRRLKPEDWQFHETSDGEPLLDFTTRRLFNGDHRKAQEQLVVASRVAPIRTAENALGNRLTSEAFAGMNVLLAKIASDNGQTLIMNTQRFDMEKKVLALPNGITFNHTRAEQPLYLPDGTIRLKRRGRFMDEILSSYTGYFLKLDGIQKVLMRHFGDCDPAYLREHLMVNGRSPEETLMHLGSGLDLMDRLDADTIAQLKPSDVRKYTSLFTYPGEVLPGLSGAKLKRELFSETDDAAHAYLTDTMTRFEEGMKVLFYSAEARAEQEKKEERKRAEQFFGVEVSRPV